MTYLTESRDALAKALYGSKIGDPYYMERADAEEIADALIASGAVIDAPTLADDEALVVHVAENIWHDETTVPERQATALGLRALAAALTERRQS